MNLNALSWAEKRPTRGAAAKLVLMLLATDSGSPEAVCFPDVNSIAVRANVPVEDVNAALLDFKETGLIVEFLPDFKFIVLMCGSESMGLAAQPVVEGGATSRG
ncbi:hypothetical protein HUN39_04730 [Methylocystis sp. FS]|uniref:hypothetical protein n=1 Tax=Methylocystis silviterrae TaxID=2743612 RepID=UPI0015815922|nr:hypothetical protein [Methylocystis silviterrae]NUJ79344.1 hypothetical protein [Methylocystis silviterrae]